jgi:large subunit ribosomal protein L19e
MRFDHQRRLAAAMLGCGVNRVHISTDPAEQENIFDAITREQVRELIRRNVVTMRPEQGVSRARARLRAIKRKQGRRRGQGTRRGSSNARTPEKQAWMANIRRLRTLLRDLKFQGRIDVATYRLFYRQAKGGMFKSKAHLTQQLQMAGLLKEAAK